MGKCTRPPRAARCVEAAAGKPLEARPREERRPATAAHAETKGQGVQRWTWTAGRRSREAKAELEEAEPGAQAEIKACENVMALDGGMVMSGTWTSNPDELTTWLDDA